MIRLGSALGAADQVYFSVPASTPEGSTARVEVRAASTLNPAHRDTVRFVVIAGSMALHQVMVIPDSVTVFPGRQRPFCCAGLRSICWLPGDSAPLAVHWWGHRPYRTFYRRQSNRTVCRDRQRFCFRGLGAGTCAGLLRIRVYQPIPVLYHCIIIYRRTIPIHSTRAPGSTMPFRGLRQSASRYSTSRGVKSAPWSTIFMRPDRMR